MRYITAALPSLHSPHRERLRRHQLTKSLEIGRVWVAMYVKVRRDDQLGLLHVCVIELKLPSVVTVHPC